ncbi:hypothetical protein [Streptomyces sp. NPDC054765]
MLTGGRDTDLIVTENITLDGVIDAEGDRFGPAGEAGVDRSAPWDRAVGPPERCPVSPGGTVLGEAGLRQESGSCLMTVAISRRRRPY